MKILAFETSCDDTSIAVFENEQLLSMETASQIKIHNITWWVVPEVAAREHANSIFWVLDIALEKAKLSLNDIDYIWVTTHPWLLPSLLTGITVASTISTTLKIPIIPINHIESHIFANFLERKKNDIIFPAICLTVSGWHNEIYHLKNMWDFESIWATNDDAAGEAFDKVAKMMWLWYPWWPIISKLAKEYESSQIPLLNKEGLGVVNNKKPLFPRVWLVKKEADFSFSGLKSAVKREVDKRKSISWELTENDKKEISFEFENAVCEVLSFKLINSALQRWVKNILLAWWVSANNKLKELITTWAKKNNLNFIFPTKPLYSTDNAAMVWINTYYKIKYNKFEKDIYLLKV